MIVLASARSAIMSAVPKALRHDLATFTDAIVYPLSLTAYRSPRKHVSAKKRPPSP
jgi:hypothetical protein